MIGRLLLYDSLRSSFDFVRLRKNPGCKICSDKPEIADLIDYADFCGVPGHDIPFAALDAEFEITPTDLAKRLKRRGPIRLIDVREPHELAISRIDGGESVPLGTFAAFMHDFQSDEEIVLICKSGTRSARALHLLLGAGFNNVKNLRGGINAWAREVDPQVPIY
jgi:adenylyltransferase/sulfurtransferase